MSKIAQSSTPLVASKMSQPVVYWALFGVCWVAFTVYVFGSWMLSPDFRPVPVGTDPVPGQVLFWVRFAEISVFSTGMFLLWKYVASPLIKTRDIPIDGLLLFNFLLLWWTDPMVNYANMSFMYNGYLVNMGGWTNFIPGFSYPNQQNIGDPLLLMGGVYLVWWLLTSMLGCWVLRVMKEKWPNLGIGWGIAAVFVVIAAICGIIEPLCLRAGIWAYPGIPASWSLFPGKAWQFPLYEMPIIGFCCAGFTLLRYYRDDKGLMFVEKGLDRLNLSKPTKRLLTFLAIAGFAQPFFAIGYYLPWNLFTVHAVAAPAYPSYMRTAMCGEGTEYACPNDEWVPIPHRDGKLSVRPDDPRLPQAVRDAQGIAKSGDPYASK